MTRMVKTKLRCPRCKCSDLYLIETGTWTSQWKVIDGRFDREEGSHEPDSVDRLDAKCRSCGWIWKPRGAFQIDHVISETAQPSPSVTVNDRGAS
jgi:hypothetical protein